MPLKQSVTVSEKAKNILHLNKDEKKVFLNSIDFILLDCDGVIWMLTEPIPNTGHAIELLKKAGKQCKFISNNSMRTDNDYINKFTSIGVKNVNTDDIIHPVKTISRYINKHLHGQAVFSLCCPIMNEMFIQNGVNIKIMKPDIDMQMENMATRIRPSKVNDEDEDAQLVAAVVMDLNFNITFGELARAMHYLTINPNCQLLVGAADRLVPVTKDFTTIGSSGFMHILQDCSGTEAIILGKPGALLGVDIKNRFQINDQPNRALFIGDNLITDIQFGISSGFQTLFVLTGACTYDEMKALPEHLKPDYYANGLSDFIEFFKNLNV